MNLFFDISKMAVRFGYYQDDDDKSIPIIICKETLKIMDLSNGCFNISIDSGMHDYKLYTLILLLCNDNRIIFLTDRCDQDIYGKYKDELMHKLNGKEITFYDSMDVFRCNVVDNKLVVKYANKLYEEILNIKNQIEELKYQPGGPIARQAEEHFNEVAKKLT